MLLDSREFVGLVICMIKGTIMLYDSSNDDLIRQYVQVI